MVLKKYIFVVLLSLFLLSISYAGNFGVGAIIGEPTGLSFRLWQNKNQALDFGVAWSINGNILHLSVDYVSHYYNLLKPTAGSMPLYYGVGIRILSSENTNFGVRIPLGVLFIPKGMTLDFFFEIVPTLELVPATKLDVDGAFGFRYYF